MMNKETYLQNINGRGDFMKVLFFYYRMNGGTERDEDVFRVMFSKYLQNPFILSSLDLMYNKVIRDVDKYFKIEHNGRF